MSSNSDQKIPSRLINKCLLIMALAISSATNANNAAQTDEVMIHLEICEIILHKIKHIKINNNVPTSSTRTCFITSFNILFIYLTGKNVIYLYFKSKMYKFTLLIYF